VKSKPGKDARILLKKGQGRAPIAYEFTGRMFEAISGMLFDMLAAVARKDHDDRRRRQAQGQAKANAKAKGRYKATAASISAAPARSWAARPGCQCNELRSRQGCARVFGLGALLLPYGL
jgi:hypothetical protein